MNRELPSLPWIIDWLAAPSSWAILLGGVVAIQIVWIWYIRGQAARRLRRNRALGAAGETQARKLLEHQGYRVRGEQVSGEYDLLVDDEIQKVRLRADFLVERRGEVFVAEAKAGFQAGKISDRNTRRQILEYTVAFDVDGVILVDVARGRLAHVRFP